MGLISRVSSRTYRKPETKSFSKKKWLFPRSPNPECQRASPKSDPDSQNKPPPSRKRKLLPKMTLVKQREVITKARAYAAEYAAEAKAFVNNTKAAKAAGNYFVEGEEKLALVIRIRGVNQISPKPKKTLQLLRLRQTGNACFIRLNKASIQMLRICDPFIAWGYPTQSTIKNMIYKRGAVKINNESRSPTTLSLKRAWALTASSASKTWSTKFIPSVRTSRLSTTTCSQSSFLAHEVAGGRSPTTLLREVTSVTENNTSTIWSRK